MGFGASGFFRILWFLGLYRVFFLWVFAGFPMYVLRYLEAHCALYIYIHTQHYLSKKKKKRFRAIN